MTPLIASLGTEMLLATVKVLVVILMFAMPIGSLMTLLGDRRQSSAIQNRIGPNRARIPFLSKVPILGGALLGIPHFLADGLKMLFKEDIIPEGANRFWHNMAPALSLFPAVVLWAVIPFGNLFCVGGTAGFDPVTFQDTCVGGEWRNYLSISNLDAGLLYVFAVSSISVYGAAIAGWASNAKYSLLGGLRSTAQMISYEVTMGLSVAGLILIYGTLNLNEMVQFQMQVAGGWMPLYGIVVQPLAFFIFLIAMMAETKRAPFDAPEGEAEIVAGYFTEFSSMKFAIIQLSEYIATVFVGSLIATMFLGGWHFPGLSAEGFRFFEVFSIDLPQWLVAFIRFNVLAAKTIVILWLQFMLRWTLPRLRYDQIMDLGWKLLLPLSIANLLVTAFIVFFFLG